MIITPGRVRRQLCWSGLRTRFSARTGARGLRRHLGRALPGHHQAVAGTLGRVHPVPGLPARGQARHLHHEPDRQLERPAAEGHPQPRPVPQRSGRPEGALPGGPEPAGIPRPEHRDPQFRVETGAPGVHDLLRRTNPNPMKTATITYTDDRTLPSRFTSVRVHVWSDVLRVSCCMRAAGTGVALGVACLPCGAAAAGRGRAAVSQAA